MLGWLSGAAWLAIAWAWLGLHPALDAEALSLRDLLLGLQNGQGLAHWSLPPAPALFPDLQALWVAQRLAPGLAEAQRLFGLMLAFGFWVALSRFLKLLFDVSGREARAMAGAGLLLGLSLHGAGLARWLLPGQHGTALMASILLWTWGLRQKHKPASPWRSGLVGVLSAAALVSDPWLLAWGLGPLALLALRLNAAGRARVWLTLVFSALLAYGFRLGLSASGAQLEALNFGLGLQRGPAAWGAWIGRQVPALIAHAPLLAAALAGLGLWAWPREGRGSGPRVLLLAWALAALLTLFGGALGPAFDASLAVFVLLPPVFCLPQLVAERWPAWSTTAWLSPLLGGLLILNAAKPSASQVAAQAVWLEAQLQARSLRYGWASPALARPLRLFGERKRVILPMASGAGRVDPWYFSVDRSLFAQGAALERPQFVVVNGLDPALLQARLSTPREVLQGQGLTVWIRSRNGE